ncbi:MAG TPA: hypothetical protein VIK86_08720 [Candidatus Paceibacterota bacterium]
MINNTNTYIMNLEVAYIFKAVHENKEFTTIGMDKTKLFTATMPYSLEIIRAIENEFYIEDNRQYTKMFVNINFKKDCFDFNEITTNNEGTIVSEEPEVKPEVKYEMITIENKKNIRKHIYTKGFTIDFGDEKVDYCFYKRGASKAKNGSDIFVKKEYYTELINRTNLDLVFKPNERMDMTSVYAYQALIMSGVEFTINIEADEILIIDDIFGKEFKFIASVTRQIAGKLETKDELITRQNCLSDGQGLLDESVFEEYDKSDKGFMLLRSDWMKCCAFNTKLRAYWKNKDIPITEIIEKLNGQPTGRILQCDKIKLVITPNSLKWLKLEYKFKRFKKNPLKKCYLHWIEHIDNIFGVVKCDKQGNFGTWNRTTYQLLNSLPLSYDEVQKLVQYEIDYVMSLKNDFAVFKNFIGQNISDNMYLKNSIFLNDYFIVDDEADINDEDEYITSKDFMQQLLSVNSNFRYNEKFKDWKKEQIEYYEENLRSGKLRLKDTIYATLFSNPFSMLQATIGEYEQGKCPQEDREIWCSYFSEGQELCGSRNPHVNSGNVMLLINKYHDEYKHFNLTPNILIINANDNDILDRAQGADTDSDNFLLLPIGVLVEKARICEKEYHTPINMVKGEKKNKANNNLTLARLDIKLSNNFIGRIINQSQVINSYMWDCKFNEADQGKIDKLYETSSKLSSLSQIEIDRSKKTFDNIKMSTELALINNIIYKEEKLINSKYFKINESIEIEITENEHDEIKINNKIINSDRRLNKLYSLIENLPKDDLQNNDVIKNTNILIEKEKKKLKKLPEKNSVETQQDIIKVIKKMIVPTFFKYIAEDNKHRVFKKDGFNCPMDYLQSILDKNIKKPNGTPLIEFKSLLIRQKDLDEEGNPKQEINTKQFEPIYEIVKKCGKKLNSLNMKTCKLNDKAKNTVRRNAKKEAVEELSKKKINSKTILCILRKAFKIADDDLGFHHYAMTTLKLLHLSHRLNALNCFVNYNINEEYLIRDENGNIDIFGEKYKKIKNVNWKNIKLEKEEK